MNLKFWKKQTPKKPVSKARDWFNSITFAIIAATLFRWTTVEAFVIPTPSMEGVGITNASTVVQRMSVAAMIAKVMELNQSLALETGFFGVCFFQNFRFISARWNDVLYQRFSRSCNLSMLR